MTFTAGDWLGAPRKILVLGLLILLLLLLLRQRLIFASSKGDARTYARAFAQIHGHLSQNGYG